MNSSTVLNLVADYIQQYGWDKAKGWNATYGQPACLEGAGKAVCRHLGFDKGWYFIDAYTALQEYVDSVAPELVNPLTGHVTLFVWNDLQDSSGPIIEVLRAAAVIEAARESKVEVSA